jgi:hypothetical protein
MLAGWKKEVTIALKSFDNRRDPLKRNALNAAVRVSFTALTGGRSGGHGLEPDDVITAVPNFHSDRINAICTCISAIFEH